MENGKYVVKPLRYQCRIAGKPVNYDVKCFGYTHAVMLVDVFFENIKKAKYEKVALALAWRTRLTFFCRNHG
ncbi:hypothetical protein AWB73_05087 [Caballeronia turbans]|jgi:hypothetical protein|nr:hypothetical protein AWB73_05087 [Caballeronia turbans]